MSAVTTVGEFKLTSRGAAGSVRTKHRGLRNEPATTGTVMCEVSWITAALLCWTHTNAVPFHATTPTKTPGNNTPKTPVRLLYMPEARMANMYEKQRAKKEHDSGLGVWGRQRKTKWSKASAWLRWRSADSVISHWLKDQWDHDQSLNQIIFSSPWTNCQSNVIGEAWLKICCHGNSIEAQSLLQCLASVLDKERERENQVTAGIKEVKEEEQM